jgi:hypothetical protein
LRNSDQGADTILWLATADRPTTSPGKLWHDRTVRPEYRFGIGIETEADREQLWNLLEEHAALRSTSRL